MTIRETSPAQGLGRESITVFTVDRLGRFDSAHMVYGFFPGG